MKHEVSLPKKWNGDLAYLFGLITGDGSLPKTKSMRNNGKYQERYQIQFYSDSKKFLEEVYISIFTSTFGISPKININRNIKKILYNCRIESKTIYGYMVVKGLCNGKKARIAKIPKMPKKYQKYFLAGILDTDGGKKGNGFGLSTSSPYLADLCKDIFNEMKIKFNSCPWKYKGHTYHQIYAGKNEVWKILKFIPIRNQDKIKYINSIASVAQSGRALNRQLSAVR